MTELQILQEIRDLLTAYTPAREVMTADEAAEYLRVSRAHLWELKLKYRLPFSKMGKGRIAFRKGDLDNWLNTNTIRKPEDEIRWQKQEVGHGNQR